MKFKIDSTTLIKGLETVSPAINNKHVLPILDSVLIESNGTDLKITATDLQTTIATSVTPIETTEGKCTIPAKMLLDTLKSLPQQDIAIHMDEGYQITIVSTQGNYKMPGENADEYPEVPDVGGELLFEVESGDLQHALGTIFFALATDELRQSMTCVNFDIKGNTIDLVSTDAQRLVKYTIAPNMNNPDDRSILISRQGIRSIISGLNKNGTVKVNDDNSMLHFKMPNATISVTKGQHTYPDYNAVIPTETVYEATVDRTDLLTALGRVNLYSNLTTNLIKIYFSNGELKLSAQNLDFASEAEELVPCDYNSEAFMIGINGSKVVEAIKSITAPRLKLEMSSAKKAIRMYPSNDNNVDRDIMVLIMPVMTE